MKKNLEIFYLLLLIFLGVNIVSSQETKVKIQFNVFEENGDFFSGLKAQDIQILQNKKPLQVSSLELKTDNSLEVIIMIDASASQERTLPNEKKIAEYFIDNVLKKERDRVAIAKFSGSISIEQDFTNDFSRTKEQVKKIEFEPPAGYIGGGIVAGSKPPAKNSADFAKGSTSIWDSIKQIIQTVSKIETTNSRRAVILISDGVNTFGDVKLKEAIEASIKYQIPIYAVGIGDKDYGGIDRKTLEKLTEQTNGVLIVPEGKSEKMLQQLKKLEQGLRSTYEITFEPSTVNSKDSLQEVKIEVINPELRKRKLQILQPKGFFK